MRAYGTYEGMQKRLVERIAAELEGSGMHLGRHRAGADFAEPVGPSVSGTSLRVGGKSTSRISIKRNEYKMNVHTGSHENHRWYSRKSVMLSKHLNS